MMDDKQLKEKIDLVLSLNDSLFNKINTSNYAIKEYFKAFNLKEKEIVKLKDKIKNRDKLESLDDILQQNIKLINIISESYNYFIDKVFKLIFLLSYKLPVRGNLRAN